MIKKILKNKIVDGSIIMLDIIIILLICYFGSNIILDISIIIIIHLLMLIIFFIFVLKLPIINYQKIHNKKIINEKRKKLLDGEIYSKELDIKTFDGSGSLTHPSALYFENGFNGYKFWMAFTPYDNDRVDLENPCIIVSNDGINWEVPEKIKNPLLKIIEKQKPLKYYNDPFLIYTDKLELWYRYTIEDKEFKNYIYRICSKDGISWSEPELIIDDNNSYYMSLSIVKKDNQYYMYYFDIDYYLHMRSSKDLINWGKEVKVNVNDFDGQFWHGEVRLVENNFELLFMDRNYNLYFAFSKDGKNFKDTKSLKLYYEPEEHFYKNKHLYKSSFLNINNKLYLYVPYSIIKLTYNVKNIFHKKWKLTLFIKDIKKER